MRAGFMAKLLITSLILLLGQVSFATSGWLNWPQTFNAQSVESSSLGSTQDQALSFFQQMGVLNQLEIPDREITRAEWAVLLGAALRENPTFLSEANFYADVPTSHWAYAAIEQLRLKNVVLFDEAVTLGGFAPEQPVLRQDAILWLSRLLPALPETLLMQHGGYLLPFYGIEPQQLGDMNLYRALVTIMDIGLVQDLVDAKNHLRPINEPLSCQEAIQMAYRFKQFELQQQFQLELAEKRVPAGVQVSLSPNAITFWPQIQVGQPISLLLAKAIPATLSAPAYPEKSKVVGLISEVTLDKDNNPIEAQVLLRQLILGNGQRIKIGGRLQLLQKDNRQVLLPEEVFTIVTE